jgi:L-seryl-tRNA(Ser) seleniumtransferase
MTYLTKAEQVVVVNNNAAAVFLCLKTFGEKGETIVSRGELIEIGGSFRIPDIMKSSGTKMIEVGTTNKTRLSDFENAITENTKILFKAHRSNFYMEGFTEEVELKDLAALAHKHNLIMIYDIGSGLLRKPESLNLKDEEDIASAIEAGVDIISFSGDKLLGGPQAGIIAGRKEFIGKIAKAPLMRALRVGKLTTSALLSAMRNYMDEKTLLEHNPIFRFLNRNSDELQTLATILKEQLQQKQIECQIITSNAYVGGGTLPKTTISSFSVEILSEKINAEKLYFFLQKLPNPIVGILREGRILFDVFTLNETEIKALSLAIEEYIKA